MRQASIGPAEFTVLVNIYRSVIAEPWFTADEAKRNLFRRFIIKALQAGDSDAAELTEHCREMARLQFSEPTSSDHV